MITCNNKAPEGWHCTRLVGHEGPCAAVPNQEYLNAQCEKETRALQDLACKQPTSEVESEAIKMRWTIVTLIKSINVLLAKPFLNVGRYENLTLALRHLEDAESRLNRIIN